VSANANPREVRMEKPLPFAKTYLIPICLIFISLPSSAQPQSPGTGSPGCDSYLSRPRLLSTSAVDQAWAGYTYHVEGELVPALTVELNPQQSVYFEHHIMLWKHPAVRIGLQKLKGAFKRIIAGMQVFVTEATGPGQISFSRDGAGHIFALHLSQGDEVHVREHQFLAASSNIGYTFQRVRGVSNMLFGGTGFFIDKFHCNRGEGILWLHGYGNVFEKVLAPGEQIEVEPGGWLYKDLSVGMETNLQNFSTGWFGSFNFVTNRFTGPGRIAIQSMYLHMPTSE
jgi:uncharacterized protein (AIM24 family)